MFKRLLLQATFISDKNWHMKILQKNEYVIPHAYSVIKYFCFTGYYSHAKR
jgi:hypothetical protein